MKRLHPLVFAIVILLLTGCKFNVNMSNSQPSGYRLANAHSLYLRQHAKNPVEWFPWGDEAFERAREKDQLIIISIGYSSCHWCHVMAHESFEDTAVAWVMNRYFVSIKVDREERPDLDQVYMNAVQLMSGQGGWPLNVVALPDGRPIWGGTYFSVDDWVSGLTQLADLYRMDREKVLRYADQMARGIAQLDLVPPNPKERQFHAEALDARVTQWARNLDYEHGGPKRAPKFPSPSSYRFLLQYASVQGDTALLDQVRTTLNRMVWGGIYDQVGGGWTRYSTDPHWKVPHFEKMLYDNAQLLQLYAEGYAAFQDASYLETIHQTTQFLEREFRQASGGYASALDADSEGEEGRFYIWSEEELRGLIPSDEWPLFEAYFSVNASGRWEGSYILLRTASDAEFAVKHDLSLSELRVLRASWLKTLFTTREVRIRPALDPKVITSWNALLVSGYCAVYRATAGDLPGTASADSGAVSAEGHNAAFPADWYRTRAVELMRYLQAQHTDASGALQRTSTGGTGYLDDYAFMIRAALDLYEISGDEAWLQYALREAFYTFDHFFDEKSEMFYYTPAAAEQLVSRPLESEDNVIPSSNAVMAHNLFVLAHHLERTAFEKTALQMLWRMDEPMNRFLSSYPEWARLYHYQTAGFQEVAVTGPKAEQTVRAIFSWYRPLEVRAWTEEASELPLLRYRGSSEKTQVFVCEHGACQLPVDAETYVKGLAQREEKD